MAVTYKDIDELSQKSSVAGTEKLPVSDTQYITPSQITENLATKADVLITDLSIVGAWNKYPDHNGQVLALYMQVQGYSGYTHKVIPITGVSTLQIKANASYNAQFVLVKTYTEPASTGKTYYDFATGETERRVVTKGTTSASISVPSDANYIIVKSLDGSPSASQKPDFIKYDGVDVCDGIIGDIETLLSQI